MKAAVGSLVFACAAYSQADARAGEADDGDALALAFVQPGLLHRTDRPPAIRVNIGLLRSA
jgi:hypothetical protein